MSIIPAFILAHLQVREGFRDKPYRDSLGKWTVGTGHLLSRAEIAQYGLARPYPRALLEEWLRNDALKAYKAALTQAAEMRVSDPEFIGALTSVNFQLGTAWTKEFNRTWRALVEGDYEQAIANLELSKWKKQTPVRVRDFQAALRRISR
jgi:GH24 family phage-related lysozyme (muramidase)